MPAGRSANRPELLARVHTLEQIAVAETPRLWAPSSHVPRVIVRTSTNVSREGRTAKLFALQRLPLAEQATQLGKISAQGPERVVRFAEQQPCELLPACGRSEHTG